MEENAGEKNQELEKLLGLNSVAEVNEMRNLLTVLIKKAPGESHFSEEKAWLAITYSIIWSEYFNAIIF